MREDFLDNANLESRRSMFRRRATAVAMSVGILATTLIAVDILGPDSPPESCNNTDKLTASVPDPLEWAACTMLDLVD